MKRTFSIVFALIIAFSLVSTCVYAKDINTANAKYTLKSKEEVLQVLQRAKNGDIKAINTFKDLKAFKKNEAKKVLDNVELSASEGIRSIKFDDNSEIEISIYQNSRNEIQSDGVDDGGSASYEHGYVTAEWFYIYRVKVLGIEMARYTVVMEYEGTESDIELTYKYHTGSYVYPYKVTPKTLAANISSGAYVRCTGIGSIKCEPVDGYELTNYNVTLKCYAYWFYADNRCTLTIT